MYKNKFIDKSSSKLNIKNVSLLLFLLLVYSCFMVVVETSKVTYDHRSLLIDDRRVLLISGSVHYPRSTPSMWRTILQESKAAGINLIDTYVFWNIHQPERNTYNFEGNANIKLFLDICKELGLYVNLRIGPYVCAEWNYGGFPYWLKEIPGVRFRDHNEPFMQEMERWMRFITKYLKDYFAPRGGPIIMSQVENEYGWVQLKYGDSGKRYAEWSASMARSLDIGVPWIMCQQDNIDDAINTCNGFYCHDWIESHWETYPNQPAFFTENWPGWFQQWEWGSPKRPVQDILYSAGAWFGKGGSLLNYYMWHGGTNFGRWSSPFVTTSYDYDAAIDEYGAPSEPKYSRSSSFNNLIQKYSYILLAEKEIPKPVYLGGSTEVINYSNGPESLSFLINKDSTSVNEVQYAGSTIKVQPWSVMILYNNQSIFDTSFVPAEQQKLVESSTLTKGFKLSGALDNSLIEQWSESFDFKYDLHSQKPAEQLSMTRDKSDYLWYVTDIDLQTAGAEVVTTNITGIYHAFIDGKYQATVRYPTKFNINSDVPLGKHKLQILHTKLGLPHYTLDMESVVGGIVGNVYVGGVDVTNNGWSMKSFSEGERLEIYNPKHYLNAQWKPYTSDKLPITWYKINFKLDRSTRKYYSLDMSSMNKGMIWLNGENVGRYWMSKGWGCNGCEYQGGYAPEKCQINCGEPSQKYYHLPQDWLKNGENVLIVYEEVGGDAKSIKLMEKDAPFETTFIESTGSSTLDNTFPPNGHVISLGGSISHISYQQFIYLYCFIVLLSILKHTL